MQNLYRSADVVTTKYGFREVAGGTDTVSAAPEAPSTGEELKSLEHQLNPLSPEEKSAMQSISAVDFLKKPSVERLRYVTKGGVSAEKVANGEVDEVEFTFTHNGQHNKALWLKTTAGQVLPEAVTAVESNGTTYTRRGFGEFFSGNKRLQIHGGEEHGYTKLKVTQLSTDEEVQAAESRFAGIARTALTAKGINQGSANYDRLLKAATMGAARYVNMDLALAVAQSDVLASKSDESSFLAEFEEALTQAHRLQDGLSDTDRMNGADPKLAYAMKFLRPFLSDGSEMKTVLTSMGYDEAQIRTAQSGGLDISQLPENAQELAQSIQNMSPQQVWQLRKQKGPSGLLNYFKNTGLYDVQLPKSAVEQMVSQALDSDGDVFPGLSRADQVRQITALIKHESQFRPFNVSPTGALGLGQMIKGNYVDKWNFNPFRPGDCVRYAAEHLRLDYRRFRSVDRAMLAYNRGAGYVARHGMGGPSREGRNYVPAVRKELAALYR